jgi:trans-aconitate 2-methyltransferase
VDFNWLAENYRNNSQFQYDHAIRALKTHQFTGNEYVLDVGCGDGKITADIAARAINGKTIGIDSSKTMIEFAQSMFIGDKERLSFDVCLAEDLDYDNYFDLITSFSALHWVKDQLSFLSRAKKALKKNGKVVLNFYPKHPVLWDSINDITSLEKWSSYFDDYQNPHISYSVEKYKELSITAGLSVSSIKESAPVAFFQKKEDMEHFLKSWLPHIDQLECNLRDEFISEITCLVIEKNKALKMKPFGMPFKKIDAILINTSE